MKRLLLLSLLIACVSCEKQKTDEWKYWFGYTKEDVIGTYSHSNLSDAFSGLSDGEFSVLCDDAEITVTAGEGNQIGFLLKSAKAGLSHPFSGIPSLNGDDFLIQLQDSKVNISSSQFYVFRLSARVLQDNDGRVRLQGSASKDYYVISQNHPDPVFDYKKSYYFDVINN